MKNQRKDTRSDLMLDVDVNELISGDKLGNLRELSPGGASLLGVRDLNAKPILTLNLVVLDQKGREHHFQFKARVTYSMQGDNLAFTTGLCWMENNIKQQEVIEKLIEQFGLWESTNFLPATG